jgi:uncharacterized protein
MRALLDVNVLIALLDSNHSSHRAALEWFSREAAHGWASCPLTQNGCIRIISLAGYPGARPISDVVDRLREMTVQSVHEFWADDISVLDSARIDVRRVHGSQQLTDAYLLALAVAHGGRLVTFDRAMPVSAVVGVASESLLQL